MLLLVVVIVALVGALQTVVTVFQICPESKALLAKNLMIIWKCSRCYQFNEIYVKHIIAWLRATLFSNETYFFNLFVL